MSITLCPYHYVIHAYISFLTWWHHVIVGMRRCACVRTVVCAGLCDNVHIFVYMCVRCMCVGVCMCQYMYICVLTSLRVQTCVCMLVYVLGGAHNPPVVRTVPAKAALVTQPRVASVGLSVASGGPQCCVRWASVLRQVGLSLNVALGGPLYHD